MSLTENILKLALNFIEQKLKHQNIVIERP